MQNQLFDIKGKVVVITGGTGVLGQEIGKYLAQEGAIVVLLGRKQEIGDALAQEIQGAGGEAMFLACDVMDVASVQSVCDTVLARYGKVDALLNAAGGNMPGATIAPTGTIFDVQVEEFQKVLNVNLTGTVIPTQIFLKPMVDINHHLPGSFKFFLPCFVIACGKTSAAWLHSVHSLVSWAMLPPKPASATSPPSWQTRWPQNSVPPSASTPLLRVSSSPIRTAPCLPSPMVH